MISALYVGFGAFFGALSRWGIGTFLNPLSSSIPMGTLFVNLLGGYLIGLIAPLTPLSMDLSGGMRLLLITGFLGSFTTFSTFSAEVVTFFIHGQVLQGVATVALHVLGSLFMTYLGVLTIQLLLLKV